MFPSVHLTTLSTLQSLLKFYSRTCPLCNNLIGRTFATDRRGAEKKLLLLLLVLLRG